MTAYLREGSCSPFYKSRSWFPEGPKDFPKDWPLTIYKIQRKTKIRDPLFQKYWQLHDGDHRALNQARSPSEQGCVTAPTPQANSNTICPWRLPFLPACCFRAGCLLASFSSSQALGSGEPPWASHSLCLEQPFPYMTPPDPQDPVF